MLTSCLPPSPSPPRIRSRRRNVRLRSPSPEEPQRRAQPRAGATAPVPRRPPPTPTPHQPRFTAEGRPIFQTSMDAATVQVDWVILRQQGGSHAVGLPFRGKAPFPGKFSTGGSPRVPRRQLLLGSHTYAISVSRVSGTVRVCVRVCVCHGVARIQSTGPLHGWLSTGPRVALHGSTGGSPRVPASQSKGQYKVFILPLRQWSRSDVFLRYSRS